MLFYLIVWILIAVPFFLTGSAILSLIDSRAFDREGDRFVIAVWLGAIVFAVALQFISLFSPLSPVIGLAVFLSGSLAPLKLRGVREEFFRVKSAISVKALMIGAALIFVIAAYTSQPPNYYDTGLYHLQSILWLARYGAVPGVALIHDRLGYTSSWFALAAPFHHGGLELRSIAILGGFVISMQVIHIVITVRRMVEKKARLEDWFLAIATLLIVPVPLVHLIPVSSSPDLPVMALTVLVTWAMVVIAGKNPTMAASLKLNSALIPLVLAAGMVTLKLNALPVLAISLLFFNVLGGGSLLKRVSVGAAVSAALVAPQLLSGVITSGFPGYPGPVSFDLPWSVGIESAKMTYAGLLSWARWRDYFVDAETPGWLWVWLGDNQGVVLFLLCSMISAAVILYSKGKGKFYGAGWVVSLAALGATWVLYTVPNARFLVSYMMLIPAFITAGAPSILSPAIFIAQLIPETDLKIRLARFLTLVASIIAYTIILRYRQKDWAMKASFAFLVFSALLPVKVVLFSLGGNLILNRSNISSLIVPPAVVKLTADDLIRRRVNDIDYVIPKTGRRYEQQCWAADLPCTPQLTREDIKLRIPALGIRGGFVRSN